MRGLVNNSGNIDDIRCSLKFYKGTKAELRGLKAALDDENKNRKRKTVIAMLERAIKKVK